MSGIIEQPVLDRDGAACRTSMNPSDHMYTRTGEFIAEGDIGETIPGREPPWWRPTPRIVYRYVCLLCGMTLTVDSPLCTAL